jgi:AcrR family transcriptional regulator
MSRDDKSQSVRNRIVETARVLFAQNGYADTTIRQISAMAGISTGSIYHFFEGKDGIFKLLVEEVIQRSAGAADAMLAKDDGPYVALALELSAVVRVFCADARIATLFSGAHRTWTIRRFIIERGSERNRQLFASVLPDWEAERYYMATLTIAGVIAVLVDERIHAEQLSEQQRCETLVRAALAAFVADAATIETTLGTVAERLRGKQA